MSRPFLIVLVLLICSPLRADGPTMRLVTTKEGNTIAVSGLSKEVLTALNRLEADERHKVFSLHVQRPGKSREGQPAVLGTHRVVKDVLHFEPRFALTPGVRYLAVLDLGKLDGGKSKPVEVVLSLPKLDRKPSAIVARIYPSDDRLPENLLKFYVHFSAPMDQGNSYRHIKLLDEKGKAVELPFLELDQELWNPEGTRFTLFIDPGRIKRGLKPREEVGPALEEGKRYTLVVERTWKDAEGTPLASTFRKSFTVTGPDAVQPDPKKWKLTVGKSDVRVTFPKPMDHALLGRMLWVIDARGKRVPGKIVVEEKETVWRFTPARAWTPGAYHLVADTRLEDRSGNSIGRPFEADTSRPVEKKAEGKTFEVPFEVKKSATE